MKVTIHGTGYVGLVTGLCLAEFGHEVYCFDIDQEKLTRLKQGQLPIYEEGLEPLLKKHNVLKNIVFTSDPLEAVNHATIQIIAVGTPSFPDGKANLEQIDAVSEIIAQHMQEYRLIVNKSTVPVGTVERVKITIKNVLSKRKSSLNYSVASNPEFLREGSAVKDFFRPDRIVVGVQDENALVLLRELYQPLLKQGCVFYTTDTACAELIKYAANAFLATKISFINEISQIAERLGVSIESVKKGLALDKRIGGEFLNPGCGYGGSCFPKDISALRVMAKQLGFDAWILDAVSARNEVQKTLLFEKIKAFFDGELAGKVIALWGLAFKPKTDDIRFSAACHLMELLWASGVFVRAYDPMAMENVGQFYGKHAQLKLCANQEEALIGADVLLIATDWETFKKPNFKQIKESLRYAAIFDGRNMYDAQQVAKCGISYYGIAHGLSLDKKSNLK